MALTIKLGSKGSDVIAWQQVLNAGPKPTTWTNAKGAQRLWLSTWAWPLAADGDFGAMTADATEAWQAAHGLVADGVVGPTTWGVSGQVTEATPGDEVPFVQARNYNKMAGKRCQLIIIHDMEYPEKMEAAEEVAAWFAGASAPQASAHYCVDANSVVRCVKDQDVAWHTPGKLGPDYINNYSIGIEHAGYAKQTEAEWLDDYSKAMLLRSAQLVAKLCLTYGIPPVKLSSDDLKAGQLTGITGHADCTTASGSGTHWDPGPGFPWDWYIEQVRHYTGIDAVPPVLSDGSDWPVVECEGVRYSVAPSYIWPQTIGEAEATAKRMGCELPTPALVDAIWKAADLRLDGSTLRRSDFKVWSQAEMSAKSVIEDQARKIEVAVAGRPYTLLVGMCKDVVKNADGVIGLYGWQDLSGRNIQPFFSGHAMTWGDYSQGLRLLRRIA